jgi:hypothetical protein
MLFKVEITDGNLMHNWRNYAVKRTSDDSNLMNQFVTLHNITMVKSPADLDVFIDKKNVV